MRYFKVGDKVLANCGTRKDPNWESGEVIDYEPPSGLVARPYRVKIENPIDRKDTWWFSAHWLVKDTLTNRRRKWRLHPGEPAGEKRKVS